MKIKYRNLSNRKRLTSSHSFLLFLPILSSFLQSRRNLLLKSHPSLLLNKMYPVSVPGRGGFSLKENESVAKHRAGSRSFWDSVLGLPVATVLQRVQQGDAEFLFGHLHPLKPSKGYPGKPFGALGKRLPCRICLSFLEIVRKRCCEFLKRGLGFYFLAPMDGTRPGNQPFRRKEGRDLDAPKSYFVCGPSEPLIINTVIIWVLCWQLRRDERKERSEIRFAARRKKAYSSGFALLPGLGAETSDVYFCFSALLGLFAVETVSCWKGCKQCFIFFGGGRRLWPLELVTQFPYLSNFHIFSLLETRGGDTSGSPFWDTSRMSLQQQRTYSASGRCSPPWQRFLTGPTGASRSGHCVQVRKGRRRSSPRAPCPAALSLRVGKRLSRNFSHGNAACNLSHWSP